LYCRGPVITVSSPRQMLTGCVDEDDDFRLVGAQSCNVDLHLLKQMCRLRLVDVQRCSINEKDDFDLVGAQSYVYRSSST
jgi:hypothetical protein